MKLNDTETRIVALTKQLVMTQVSKLQPYDLGHGYLWGYITLRRAQKNGKVREFTVKTLLGGFCALDHREVIRIAERAGVETPYINID